MTLRKLQLHSGSALAARRDPARRRHQFRGLLRNAEKILLSVFEGEGDEVEIDAALPARTGFVWHGFLPNAGPGLRYGFRAAGPFDISRGLRFNASKLLLDPYARAISGSLTWDDAVYDYQRKPWRSRRSQSWSIAQPACRVRWWLTPRSTGKESSHPVVNWRTRSSTKCMSKEPRSCTPRIPEGDAWHLCWSGAPGDVGALSIDGNYRGRAPACT